MPRISKRFLSRARPKLREYQRLLEAARARDVNESDTCVIVSDFLQDILGYDKYAEVTTEFAIRSTFCDLAVRVDGHVQYLIEVKSVGTELKDSHIRQAVAYAANAGIDWVLLTNGADWHAYRLRFEKPIQHEEVFVVELLDPTAKGSDQLERLYLISREAGGDAAISQFLQYKEATSRYVIAQLLLSDQSVHAVRRELRRLFPGLRVDPDRVREVIRNEVLKREPIDGERAARAEKLVRRGARKRVKAAAAEPDPAPANRIAPIA